MNSSKAKMNGCSSKWKTQRLSRFYYSAKQSMSTKTPQHIVMNEEVNDTMDALVIVPARIQNNFRPYYMF